MTDREAIECFESDCENCSVKDECKRLKEKGKLVCRNTNAISALQEREERSKPQTPCDLCAYNPPSSGDGKPCAMCPAMPGEE